MDLCVAHRHRPSRIQRPAVQVHDGAGVRERLVAADIDGRPWPKIVASVSHGWFGGEKDKQNYLGPTPAWCGMDLGVVPHGKGRYVLSGLRVIENLGTDAVADKILFNLIEWATAQSE